MSVIFSAPNGCMTVIGKTYTFLSLTESKTVCRTPTYAFVKFKQGRYGSIDAAYYRKTPLSVCGCNPLQSAADRWKMLQRVIFCALYHQVHAISCFGVVSTIVVWSASVHGNVRWITPQYYRHFLSEQRETKDMLVSVYFYALKNLSRALRGSRSLNWYCSFQPVLNILTWSSWVELSYPACS